MSDLPFGLYEQLLTSRLKAKVLRFRAEQGHADTVELDDAEAAATLARHVEAVVSRALDGLPSEGRVEKQVQITNNILRLLMAEGDEVTLPPEVLTQVRPHAGLADDRSIPPPLVPLSASDLLVNARGEPALAHALAHEIPSTDSIDLLCAFVRWHGIRVLEDQLKAHCSAGRPLRVITTVYTGSTERKALDWLVSIGAKVKVSYDTQSTRLHAKAWMFRRATGFSTAYIGSSNLSKSAMIDGVEWNVRLSQVGSPDILQKFDAAFDGYWQSPEYESYDPARDRERFDRATAGAEGPALLDGPLLFLDVEPWQHQKEILEKLDAARRLHGRHKNLVVAATGTGKTIVAALDYRRLVAERGDLRLLFVAHRDQILQQSLGAYRQVMRDGTFGELWVGGHRPQQWRHVFASIQSLSQVDPDELHPEAFDVVVVDEFHHAQAPTYQTVLGRLFPPGELEAPAQANQPRELLGLTATPERSDAADILHYFDGHITAELRLWSALERGLLCPFQYFGLHDGEDLSGVAWTRKGYDTAGLERVYTAHDARVKLVLAQLEHKHRSFHAMKALGFCVSIKHAEFMARKFSEARLPSRAVSAETVDDDRRQAIADLRAGRLRALFTVDLFNEGVDIPEVDTLLFLRPTESALVFMQQLGRGLRRHESKDCVTVLDFIGKANRKFRFDLRYRAVTGGTRAEVERHIEQGFPFLPAGSSMQLDRVAAEIVLDSLRTAIPSRRPAMVAELKALMATGQFSGRVPSLAEFVRESGLDLEDVYRGGAWGSLKRAAGVEMLPAGPQEKKLGDAIGRLLHIDDPLRLSRLRRWLRSSPTEVVDETDSRIATGLAATLWGGQMPSTLGEVLAALQAHPAIVNELLELMDLLEERADHVTYPLKHERAEAPSLEIPLSVHARYSLAEIFAAVGRLTPGHFYQHREGVYRDATTNSDLFFVTLEKADRDYSPSTLYKDYAISPTLFHWESQSTTSVESPTGQRYINHRKRGGHILLFVRHRKKQDGQTVPYTFLGPADYQSHQQERPIQFVWKLNRSMPADFFRQAKVATA